MWFAYIFAVIFPIIGFVSAIYLAVSQHRAKVCRHAIGVAATALIASGVWIAVILSAGGQDQDVATNLQNLLSSHGISASNVQCAHETGNQYQCSATVNGQQQSRPSLTMATRSTSRASAPAAADVPQ